jgi:hypothetical protein
MEYYTIHDNLNMTSFDKMAQIVFVIKEKAYVFFADHVKHQSYSEQKRPLFLNEKFNF